MSANLLSNGSYLESGSRDNRSSLLKGALLLWAVVIGFVGIFLVAPFLFSTYERPYLIPWCFALGIVTLAPLAYLAFKGKFDLFHPLVLPVWTYFFPGFVIGGLVLVGGLSQAYYLAYIRDERSDFPLTFLYIIIGFSALVAGFAFPIFRRIGDWIDRRFLPKWEITDATAKRGGLVLLAIGLACFVFAFSQGLLRYARIDDPTSFDGLLTMSTVFWHQAAIILSIHFFRLHRRTSKDYAVLAVLVGSAITTALILGSRGGLLHFLMPVIAGFLYCGRRIVAKHYAGLAGILVVLLILGAIYGTTFRAIRGGLEATSIEAYTATVPQTFETILDQGPINLLGFGLSTLAVRVELLSSVAVVVSNYEILAPYEEEFGISNNILVESTTFFIPRLIWEEKPVPVNPVRYAELYFNYSENSFSITPIADLLRNFGPIGIPIGMFLLGGILRMLHQSLIGTGKFSYWRYPFYFLLITSVSYDATFSGIVPLLFKTAVVVTVGFVIFWAVSLRIGRSKVST